MDQQQLDKVIQAITEEILGYLGTEKCTDLCGLEIDELVCPGCDQRCAEKCARKTRKVVEAGAARISAGSAVGPIEADIARLIDHTLLKPDATREEIVSATRPILPEPPAAGHRCKPARATRRRTDL